MQRRYPRGAHRRRSIPRIAGYLAGANPVSTVYGGRMVDLDADPRLCLGRAAVSRLSRTTREIWGDGANWRLGHWLNGRLASALAGGAGRRRLLADFGFADARGRRRSTARCRATSIDRIMSARDALQPLELAYFFDALESGAAIVFRHRGAEPAVAS